MMNVATMTMAPGAEAEPEQQPDEASALGFAAAREICRRRGRDLLFPAFFLPAHKRDAVYAVAAFCWMIRDVIDSSEGRLAMLADRVNEIYQRREPALGRIDHVPDHPAERGDGID